MHTIDYLECWYTALRAQVGCSWRTDDAEHFRQKLYEARRRVADPALEVLFITISPENPDCVWIMHKEVAVEKE